MKKIRKRMKAVLRLGLHYTAPYLILMPAGAMLGYGPSLFFGPVVFFLVYVGAFMGFLTSTFLILMDLSTQNGALARFSREWYYDHPYWK